MYIYDGSNQLHIMSPALPQKVLCQLATEEDDAQALMKKMDIPPKDYHLEVLRKVSAFFFSALINSVIMLTYTRVVLLPSFQMVALLQKSIGKSCSCLGDTNQRYST